MTGTGPAPWMPAGGGDARLDAPSASRNREAILAVLRKILPERGMVLEIASGSGQHAVHFADALPGLGFQPSDPSPEARASIAAWRAEAGPANLAEPLALDAAAVEWPIARADAIICINMIHIAPWSAALGLMRGAGRLLPTGGPLYLYGPFRRRDRPLEPSNAAFDENLRRRDPAWGLRELEDVARIASECGFGAPEIVEMPANNLSLIFRWAA